MTFAVTIAVASTISIAVPASAPAAGQYQGTILNANNEVVQQLQSDGASFAFTGVPAGDYTASLSRLDVTGAVIPGSLVVQAFSTGADAVVPPATVQVDVPASLTVTSVQE